MTNVRDYLSHNRLLFDGAFGTYFSQITRVQTQTPELACLTQPELVARIHREYIQAGAYAIKTNTFAAYPEFLGGKEKQEQVIRAAVRIAREAASAGRAAGGAGTPGSAEKNSGAQEATEKASNVPEAAGEISGAPGGAENSKPIFIFADLGPAPGETDTQKTEEYVRAAEIFLSEGITNFVFETQAEENGLLPAIRAIRERCADAFVMVSFGVMPDGYSPKGAYFAEMIRDMYESGFVDVTGLNCVSNPGQIRRLIEKLPPALLSRVCAMPNAGYPAVRGFRMYFDGNAPYFAQETAKIADLGVRVLGGCCGTTPSYIRALRHCLEGKPEPPYADFSARNPLELFEDKENGRRAVSANRIWNKLSAGQKVIAVELDSPRGSDLTQFMEEAGRLQAAGTDTITIADCPVAQARLDASLLACEVKQKLDLDVIPHMNCRDRNINASKALLLGDYACGIRNVLIITGDPIPSAARDEVKSVYQFNSRQMISYVRSLNAQDFSGDPFLIFAALNVNAVNFDIELKRAREKMANGADGFLTQPVLTENALENLRRAREELKGAWLFGGLIPVISEKNGRFMNEQINGIDVPEDMIAAYHGADREQGEALGRRFTDELCRKILPLVDGIYLMTPFHRIGLMEKIIRDVREQMNS